MLTPRQHTNTKVLLSLFAGSGYNEITAVDKSGKDMIIMAEFGENLKRVREEKGITQQTLADHLYVTRQAVSRWEGGSRYPDIMTAKKMAQYLGVSLDELLSDDDMKMYAEKSEEKAFISDSRCKRMQIAFLLEAFIGSLIMSILFMDIHILKGYGDLVSISEMIKSIIVMTVLCYGIYAVIYDKLKPAAMAIMSVLLLGCSMTTSVVWAMWNEIGFVGTVVFAGACVWFFLNKKNVSPTPFYLTAGIYGGLGITAYLGELMLSTEYGKIPVFPSDEIGREVLVIGMASTLKGIFLLALLITMAYSLYNKRKHATR